MNIRITRRPIGEAPEWVRDAWIGLTLPTVHGSVRRWFGVGVLTGSTNLLVQLGQMLTGRGLRILGYVVNARAAVDLLAQTQPAAADWWLANTPKLMNGRHNFVFDADACEVAQ